MAGAGAAPLAIKCGECQRLLEAYWAAIRECDRLDKARGRAAADPSPESLEAEKQRLSARDALCAHRGKCLGAGCQ